MKTIALLSCSLLLGVLALPAWAADSEPAAATPPANDTERPKAPEKKAEREMRAAERKAAKAMRVKTERELRQTARETRDRMPEPREMPDVR